MSLPLASSWGLHPSVVASAAAFKKGRQDKEPGASWVMDRVKPRQNEGAMQRRNPTSGRRRATFVAQTSVVPVVRQSDLENLAPAISEDEVAEKFAAVVLKFSKDDLSVLSGRTTEAAKHWKRANRAPNSSSLLTMGRRLPLVREWVISQMDMPSSAPSADPNQNAGQTMALLQMAANLPGQDGALAKMLLSKIQRGDG